MKTKLTILSLIAFIAMLSCKKAKTPLPTVDIRDKFIGNWSMNDTNYVTHFSEKNYFMAISKSDSTNNEIIISNFNNLGGTIKAMFSNDTFAIISPNPNWQYVWGIGFLGSGDSLIMSYGYNNQPFFYRYGAKGIKK